MTTAATTLPPASCSADAALCIRAPVVSTPVVDRYRASAEHIGRAIAQWGREHVDRLPKWMGSNTLLAGRDRHEEVPGLPLGAGDAPLVADKEATDGGGDLKGEPMPLGGR
jgi:hypothetical protein